MRMKPLWIVLGVIGGMAVAEIFSSTILTLGVFVVLFLPKWAMPAWGILCIAIFIALWIWFIWRCARWGSKSDRRITEQPGKARTTEALLLSAGILISLGFLVIMNLFATAQLLRSKYEHRLNQQETAADSARGTP